MIDLLTSSPSVWFTIPALVGTIFFSVRLVMAVTGLDFGDGADGDVGGIDGLDGSGGDAGDGGSTVDDGVEHAETSSVFKFISIQTVTAFAMGFGLTGLMALHTMKLDMPASVVIGICGGLGFAWLIIWLFKLMYSLESSGNISIRDAYGAEGLTTSSIPAETAGTGRVRVVVGDRERSYAARSESESIPMGKRIRVVHVNNDNSVTVTRI